MATETDKTIKISTNTRKTNFANAIEYPSKILEGSFTDPLFINISLCQRIAKIPPESNCKALICQKKKNYVSARGHLRVSTQTKIGYYGMIHRDQVFENYHDF
jgi:hypothetical protein